METKSDILIELASLSPLIAAIDKVNVFTVPQGYFDSVSLTVLACLPYEQGVPPVTTDLNDKAIPEGYFDQLSASILDKIKSNETAKEEIRALSPVLSDLQGNQVFEVPVGYFSQFASTVIDTIQNTSYEDELKELSPVLHAIQNANVFEVPVGYFASLPETILQKVKTPSTRVVDMRIRNLFIKYAAAAIITGAMALWVLRYIEQPGSANQLTNVVAILDESIEMGKNMNDQQFKEGLEKLTQVDIAKYLEKNGDIADVAVLRNNLDESNLPSQDDYLLDETTLDNFLKKINTNTQINN